ncbi:hypothetical protein [Segetibacter aerophilus]|uniref:Uncharacterized protein n=1 Tax=Segetibacter aerophilus TaxID=670293 RepID=A0A512BK60_9BACT|nr:hypothetical protein [Segetibacter aerophilus]GEO12295.1 hypothetical protein SAE01_47910 [Segetibacter aerophilus]
MSEALLVSMIDRLNEQQRKIDKLDEKLEPISRQSETMSVIITKVDAVRSDVQNICFPVAEIRELSLNLVTTIDLLKRPVKKEIIHHHHASKILWVTAALFLIICLLSTGWYLTNGSLEVYKANDTKYRYLKLHAGKGLCKALYFVDSLYIKDVNMSQNVIAKEEENQRKLDILLRAYEMEKAAKELKQQVNQRSLTKQNKGFCRICLINQTKGLLYKMFKDCCFSKEINSSGSPF